MIEPSGPEIYRKVTEEIYRLLHERCVPRAESFYYKLLLEIEERRQALGVSMERLSEVAGLPDRAYSKMLYPETKTGRLARWSTVQIVCDALMPDGFELRILPAKGDKILQFGQRYCVKQIAAHFNRLTRREHLQQLGRKGGAKSAEVRRLEAEKRKRRRASAQHAARMRWHKPKILEMTGKKRGFSRRKEPRFAQAEGRGDRAG